MNRLEHLTSFDCFGGTCTLIIAGDGDLGAAPQAIEAARTMMLAWHDRFSRFLPDSELSRLNADPRMTVPVSPLLLELAIKIVDAATRTDGLVDGTMVGALERVGYAQSFDRQPLDLTVALHEAPARRPASGDPQRRWQQLLVDREAGTLTRPPGLQLDSGGLLKGMFADRLAELLSDYDAFVVNCCGDLRVGGSLAPEREVEIEDPFDPSWALHSYSPTHGAVATSGITRRSWRGPDGLPAHHLLDPSTGQPVFSGVVQVTALAPTAFEAELRSKVTLLSGPDHAADHLPDGGLVVLDDGRCIVVAPPAAKPKLSIARRNGQLQLAGSGITQR